MDRQRWSNVTAARLSYSAGSPLNGGRPLEAWLEVSARCNLRCQMCAINYDLRYKPAAGRPPFFEPDLFAKLRPIFPSLLRAYLFGLGEPLLNPHLIEYIRELRAAGVQVAFNTNATLVDDAKAEAIALAGANRVTVSIDGATKETYETIRRGASWEKVMRGIRALVAAGKRHGNPTVDMSFVAMRSNVHEIPRLVEMCAELGCTGLHVEPLFAQVGSPELDEHYARENVSLAGAEVAAAAFENATARAKTLGVTFGSRFNGETEQFDYAAKSHEARWACSDPWSSIWVTSAGEVRTCCLNDTIFGNLNDQPFDAIWNGGPYRRIRDQHARLAAGDGCANCVKNGRVRNSTYFRPTQAVTCRPYFEEVPPPEPNDPVWIDNPVSGGTVIKPIRVSGLVRRGAAHEFELMIDYTPILTLDRREFDMRLPLDFLTEGAHMLWVREKASGRGLAYREMHYWVTPAS